MRRLDRAVVSPASNANMDKIRVNRGARKRRNRSVVGGLKMACFFEDASLFLQQRSGTNNLFARRFVQMTHGLNGGDRSEEKQSGCASQARYTAKNHTTNLF